MMTILHAAEDDNNTGNNKNIIDSSRVIENDLGLEIIRGTGLDNAEEISDQTWEEIEQSAPSKLMVLKNVSCVMSVIVIIIWAGGSQTCMYAYHVIIYRELLRIFSPNTYLIQTHHVHKKHSF